jgi:predicted sulfurtransferase
LVLRPAAATAAAAGMRFPTMHRPLHAATSNAVPEGEYTSVSFYKFVAVPDPVEAVVHNVQQHVKSLWKGGDVLGTILIAREGVNAQLVVPAPVVSSLAALLAAADPVFNDITINIGQTIDYSANSHIPFPYKKLVIRAKDQILTDGFAGAGTVLDFSDAGPEVPPSQWHAEIGNRDPSSANTIVLDCRNSYESDIGTFQGALPLNTTKFSETWDVLENKLAGVPKTTRVLTFCTGGIRCVKVNAYLKQVRVYNLFF